MDERAQAVYTACMPARRLSLPLHAWLFAAVLGACSSVSGDLRTATDLYRDARYEAAASWLDALAVEAPSMSAGERAMFHYLRGMTAYRLARYQDALHSLSLAADAVNVHDNLLTPTQRSVLDRTLADLTPDDASPYARAPRDGSF
jgi:hypothetical protein